MQQLYAKTLLEGTIADIPEECEYYHKRFVISQCLDEVERLIRENHITDDEIISGLPPLKEDFMCFDAVLFDHTPDAPAGYVRLNYDGRIVANNDVETGLYRFSMTYITNDEM